MFTINVDTFKVACGEYTKLMANLEILEGGSTDVSSKPRHNLLLNVFIAKSVKLLPVEKAKYAQTVLIFYLLHNDC